MKRKIPVAVGMVLLGGPLILVILMFLPSLASTGKVHAGTEYGLYVCRLYSHRARILAEENHLKFEISRFSERAKVDYATLADSKQMGGADFLIKTNFSCGLAAKEIIIVCKRQFDRVPRLQNFYRRNPAHAVGYSDGSVGLISPEEFKALNLAEFIYLSSLQTNAVSQPVQP